MDSRYEVVNLTQIEEAMEKAHAGEQAALAMAEEIERFVSRLMPVEAERRLLDAAKEWRRVSGVGK